VAALVAAGIILAACSSSPKTIAGTTSTTAAHQAGTTSTTAPASTTTSTLPSTGPLTAQAPVAIPLATAQVVAAEGPDGAVFVAAQAPDDAAPSLVYVVDGNTPAAVAEHISSGVAALAADASYLYVATYTTVTSYSRTTGNQVQLWHLPAFSTANSSDDDLVSMSAGGGKVYVLISEGNTLNVLSIDPSSPAAPASVAQAISAAVGSDGTLYYEATSHALTSLSPGGKTTTGSMLDDAPNGLGDGVQYVNTVAGGYVWVAEPAGQGLDQGWKTYGATSLQPLGSFGGDTGQRVVDTAAGPLVLSTASATSACSQQGESGVACVSRITAQGTMTAPVQATNAIALFGPDPAIIETNSAFTALSLIRLV
jgi:hypothetical protein